MSGDLPDRILAAVRAVAGEGGLPLHAPEFEGHEADYVRDCIETGWVSTAGAYVGRFERALEAFTGVDHAIAVVNGTAALHMSLMLAGVGPGDEVLTPALTFVATANAVSHCGARPHFVDACPDRLAVDPVALEAHLQAVTRIQDGLCVNRTTGATVRALTVTHVFGIPADLPALADVCARWNLALVEDAAEALGSTQDGGHVGGAGLAAALSFNGNKIVTTGGGGAILTRDPDVAGRARHLTTTARRGGGWTYDHDAVGWNYRLPNLNAALGVAQMERLPDMLARKRGLADRYAAAFADLKGIRILTEPAGCRTNAWLNALVLARPDRAVRDAILERLNADGVQVRPLWTLMHRLPMYADAPRAALPVAEALEDAVINLPSSAALGR
ncbi:LegC family aminotransferase [Brevundimonas sp.]|uniref:LegC family aminotransferase n=1 Tax=Brevundimonas sp. TaxID=1871086 RepID=UPI002612E81C|nr:LegC family aminotransferase [Brevundimonas sp.]